MSNASYDALWHDAMGELHEQLYVEGVADDEELVEGPKGVSNSFGYLQCRLTFGCRICKEQASSKPFSTTHACILSIFRYIPSWRLLMIQ